MICIPLYTLFIFTRLLQHVLTTMFVISINVNSFSFGATAPSGPGPPHSRGF